MQFLKAGIAFCLLARNGGADGRKKGLGHWT